MAGVLRRGAAAPAQRAGRAREIEAIALAALRGRIGDVHGSAALGSLAEQVVAGETDPYPRRGRAARPALTCGPSSGAGGWSR